MPFMCFLSLSLLAALLLAPASVQGLGFARCGPEIDKIITSLDVPESRIRDVTVMNIYSANGVGGGYVDRVEGWVSFNDCRGNLVIAVNNVCNLKNVYTTYECHVPNVKHF